MYLHICFHRTYTYVHLLTRVYIKKNIHLQFLYVCVCVFLSVLYVVVVFCVSVCVTDS